MASLPACSIGDHEEAEKNHDDSGRSKEVEEENKVNLVYGIEDNPPIMQLIVLGFQPFISLIGSLILLPVLISEILCFRDEIVVLSKIISASILFQGVITLLQSTFGIRLPITQGCSFSFIPPAIALMSFYGGCSDEEGYQRNATTEKSDPAWKIRLAEVNGGLMMASFVEVLIGTTGLLSVLLRFVGPLSIAPVLILLGISLTQIAWPSCHVHWGAAFFTAAVVILFSQILKDFKIPVISFSREKGLHTVRSRLLLKYSMFFGIMLGWFFCWILTESGALSSVPSDRTYKARTDIKNEVFNNTPWISLPYPGEVVWPKPSLAAFFGMLAAVIASIVESIGDYNACATMCCVPSPPQHAVNRGIAIEGLGGILSSLWCTGTGTASISSNIVIIGITRVASRRVVQMAGLMMILVGLFQIICSFLATIPDPVLGGTLMVKSGMIISVGISLLKKVDLQSSRNLFVLGLSLFFGIVMPEYLQENPGVINTGSTTFDTCATILLETGIFVGFTVAVVFDNLIPGTAEERGMIQQNISPRCDGPSRDRKETEVASSCYDLPFGMGYIRRSTIARYIPISPTFLGFAYRSGKESAVQVDLSGVATSEENARTK